MGNYPPVKLPDGKTCTSGPNCRIHGDAHKFLEQAVAHSRAQQVNHIANQTPKEVDTQLGAIYSEYYLAQIPVNEQAAYIARYKKNLEEVQSGRQRAYGANYEEWIEKAEKKKAEAEEKAAAIIAKARPFEAEYNRRPWTRAFLVDNGNGHVHKHMNCSTCYPTTQYVWLPDYSGADENKIVEAAGSSACTVCYPSAPAETLRRASIIVNPERQAARDQRDKEKAEREAVRQAKSITTPDGRPLEVKTYYGIVKTERTAEIQLVSIASTIRSIDTGKAYNSSDTEWTNKYRTDYANLVAALAFKRNLSEEEPVASLEPKFAKKFRQEWGD